MPFLLHHRLLCVSVLVDVWKDKLSKRPAINPPSDGSIHLEASEVRLRDSTVQVETNNNVADIGFWSAPEDSVSWKFNVTKSGSYDVSISLGSQDDTSQFVLKVGSEAIYAKSINTGGWDKYSSQDLGTIKIESPGVHTLEISPKSADTWKSINARSVILKPSR